MSTNPLMGLEAQAKKSFNRNSDINRTDRKRDKAASPFRNFLISFK